MAPTTIAYVLAKDESPNIGRTLGALRSCGLKTIVLDSGSTDGTPEAARRFGATVEEYAYLDHRTAYDEITSRRTPRDEIAIVLDADMIVSSELLGEAAALVESGAEIVAAPIDMWWFGLPLPRGSLCPPKPFVFRGGRAYFERQGHAEAVVDGVRVETSTHPLVHDDRKSFARYLESQVRYARAFSHSAGAANASWLNRIRSKTPLLILGTPFVSYVLRGGFLSGRAGAIYAIDRVIAEAIMFRESLASRQNGGIDE